MPRMSSDPPSRPAGPRLSPQSRSVDRSNELSLTDLFSGKRFIVVGGTGFLGKVWLSLILARFPDVGHIYLVVRPKEGLGVQERFEQKILTTEVFHPLRQQHGDDFESFISEKVTPIAGDVSLPFCGMGMDVRDAMRGEIAAVVNVAGIVDFTPPLDEALQVNAFGVQNLVELARDLGGCPILHTSTCFTAGSRTGPIEELHPCEIPFPRAGELEVSDWDPDREIAECLDVIEQARHRAGDAFRQSRFLDEAKSNLRSRDEPTSGPVLEDELVKVKRKFVEQQLSELGVERAKYWGWPNTYTYTKSLGEQIVAKGGLPFTIVRPAIVESTIEYPFPGWNEGINTSAPFIFLVRQGGLQLPGSQNNLDLIPCDMVCGGILLALGELLEGRAKPVYQAAASDTNPCTMARFFELSGLHKRRLYKKTGKGGPIISELQRRFETALLSKEQYESYGPRKLAQGAQSLGGLLAKASAGPFKPFFKPAADSLNSFAAQQKKLANVMDTFLPFTAEYQYIFKTQAIYAAYARLSDVEKGLIPWGPESIDWRKWFLEVHAPALERHVFPEMEARLKRGKPAPRAHESLTTLFEGMAERHDLKVALQRTESEGLSRISYRQLRALSLATAKRLVDSGVNPGDRVLLSGKNHPAWPVALFGILYAGATVVPFDPNLDRDAFEVIASASRAKLLIADDHVAERVGAASHVVRLSLHDCLLDGQEMEPHAADPSALALLIYTSGTTGRPKGVMLSHKNLTALIASLAPLFPLTTGDRVLSVLPLHHTFELTCGLLLPLSRGARVVYLDELNAERLTHGLEASRATALVGVPALWEMLERRIFSRVAEKGPLAEKAFEIAVEVSRNLGKTTGIDVGRALFGSVHAGLGGHLKYLVSGGAALGADTHQLFQGLGLHLAEGYGLTEAAPVLTVASGGPGAQSGHVGRAVPGVEIRIDKPNAEGVGEVLARGPNVMMGYSDDAEETNRVIDSEGWLHTGDLGKLDAKGRLSLVGRAKDVVVASNGENLYPDDIEARLGQISGVDEICVLGVSDGRGGERLACVGIPAGSDALRHQNCRDALEKAAQNLPPAQRPAVVWVRDEALPRTTTRKVKRAELRKWLEAEMQAERAGAREGDAAVDQLESVTRSLIAAVTRRRPGDVTSEMNLRGDLGIDSLMALELLVGLERKLGRTLSGENLARASTVSELIQAVRKETGIRPSTGTQSIIDDAADAPLEIPAPLREAAMEWLGRGQVSFYERVMRTKVTGRHFIPHNRRVLVVANHTSHLDMGLVKYALGTYGQGLMTLAAQDYFFEGNKYRKAYFENLTNLVPMSRTGSLRGALREAGQLLDEGRTVLIFPEGSRQEGALRSFKPAMGHLALHHNVDILPVWLGGTARALPKGSAFPKSRDIEARIGEPLAIEKLKEITHGLSGVDAARVVSRVAQIAVSSLSRGEVLDLAALDLVELRKSEIPEPAGLSGVFEELRERFVPGAVSEPLSYYFSLGDERWTVRATRAEIEVAKGKTVEAADCVLKTTPNLFERIVREAWVPGPNDFMSGQIKTNNVAHLLTMQKLFRLSTPTHKLGQNTQGAE
jgi:long-chain acyl-CoA synthetase